MAKLAKNAPHWREIVVSVLCAVLAALGKELGLTDAAREVIAWLGGTYAASGMIAGVNPKKKLETVGRQLRSKKLRLTLITVALTAVGSKFGIEMEWAIGIIGSLFNLGRGTAEALEGNNLEFGGHENTSVEPPAQPLMTALEPTEVDSVGLGEMINPTEPEKPTREELLAEAVENERGD